MKTPQLQRNLIPEDLEITTQTVLNSNNPSHKHSHYEILYLIDGSVEHVLNGNSYIMYTGDCFFLSDKDIHSFNRVSQSLHRDVLVSKSLFDKIYTLIVNQTSKPESLISNDEPLRLSISELLELEILANKFTNTMDVVKKRGIGIELLVKLINKFIDANKNTISNQLPIINRIVSLLNNTHGLKGGIATIINDLNYSKSYVCYYFKKHMGITLSQYIKEIRLKYIEYYLITTDYSLQYIADLVGFESLSYINRIFKEKHSISPIKFRKNYRFSITDEHPSADPVNN